MTFATGLTIDSGSAGIAFCEEVLSDLDVLQLSFPYAPGGIVSVSMFDDPTPGAWQPAQNDEAPYDQAPEGHIAQWSEDDPGAGTLFMVHGGFDSLVRVCYTPA